MLRRASGKTDLRPTGRSWKGGNQVLDLKPHEGDVVGCYEEAIAKKRGGLPLGDVDGSLPHEGWRKSKIPRKGHI